MTTPYFSLPPFRNPTRPCAFKTWLYLCALALSVLSTTVSATTILVLGDSLSAGFGIGQNEAWPKLLEDKLQNEPDLKRKKLRVINASISGETTAGGRNRLPALLSQHRPDIVLIELGANDGLRGLSLPAMRTNLEAMLELSKSKGARTLLIGMRLPPNYGPYADEFHRSFVAIAQKNKMPFLPFLLDRLKQTPEHFQADGLHPTREAQHLLLENVWPHLKPLLQ